MNRSSSYSFSSSSKNPLRSLVVAPVTMVVVLVCAVTAATTSIHGAPTPIVTDSSNANDATALAAAAAIGTSTTTSNNHHQQQQQHSSFDQHNSIPHNVQPNTANFADVMRDTCRRAGYDGFSSSSSSSSSSGSNDHGANQPRIFPTMKEASAYINSLEFPGSAKKGSSPARDSESESEESEEEDTDSDSDVENGDDGMAVSTSVAPSAAVAAAVAAKQQRKLKRLQQKQQLLASSAAPAAPVESAALSVTPNVAAAGADDEKLLRATTFISQHRRIVDGEVRAVVLMRVEVASAPAPAPAPAAATAPAPAATAAAATAASSSSSASTELVTGTEVADPSAESGEFLYVVSECVAPATTPMPSEDASSAASQSQSHSHSQSQSQQKKVTGNAAPAQLPGLEHFRQSNKPTFFKVFGSAAAATSGTPLESTIHGTTSSSSSSGGNNAHQHNNKKSSSAAPTEQQHAPLSFRWRCGACAHPTPSKGHMCDACGAPREVHACRVFMGQLSKERGDVVAREILQKLVPELFDRERVVRNSNSNSNSSSSSDPKIEEAPCANDDDDDDDDDDDVGPLHIEPHVHPDTGRGKGCVWVYVRDAADVDLIVQRLSGAASASGDAPLKVLVDSSDSGEIGYWVWGPNVTPASIAAVGSVPSPHRHQQHQSKAAAVSCTDAFANSRLTRGARGPKQLLPRGCIVAERPTSMGHSNHNAQPNKNQHHHHRGATTQPQPQPQQPPAYTTAGQTTYGQYQQQQQQYHHHANAYYNHSAAAASYYGYGNQQQQQYDYYYGSYAAAAPPPPPPPPRYACDNAAAFYGVPSSAAIAPQPPVISSSSPSSSSSKSANSTSSTPSHHGHPLEQKQQQKQVPMVLHPETSISAATTDSACSGLPSDAEESHSDRDDNIDSNTITPRASILKPDGALMTSSVSSTPSSSSSNLHRQHGVSPTAASSASSASTPSLSRAAYYRNDPYSFTANKAPVAKSLQSSSKMSSLARAFLSTSATA